MTIAEIEASLLLVRQEQGLNAKALLFAALVSELFRERGFEPVVVGGSAIEFYTDGAYMSGDTDICWAGFPMPTMEQRAEIMSQMPGVRSHAGGRSWIYDNLWVDLLGELSCLAEKDFARLQTAAGEVVIIPAEDVLVGRVYAARKWQGYNAEDDACGKKLMATVLSEEIPFDWDEAMRIAESPKYKCLKELTEVRSEVEMELARKSP
ncbi:MAG: hypothetical protein V4662_05195 [Verrucomicrobiota bacterium]